MRNTTNHLKNFLGSARKTLVLTLLLTLTLAFSISGTASAAQYINYPDTTYQVPSTLDLSNLKVGQTQFLSKDDRNFIHITDNTPSNIRDPKIHCDRSIPGMNNRRIPSGNSDYQFELRFNGKSVDCRNGASPFIQNHIQGNQDINLAPMELYLVKVKDTGDERNLKYPEFQFCKRNGGQSNNQTGCFRGERGGLGLYTPATTKIANIKVKPVVKNPSLTKVFSRNRMKIGKKSTLTFTITENKSNDNLDNKFSFTDTLPSGLVIADPSRLESTCNGGGITANPGGNTIKVDNTVLSNGTSSCEISVKVTSDKEGSYTNGAGNLSGIAGIDTSTVIDQTLNVRGAT